VTLNISIGLVYLGRVAIPPILLMACGFSKLVLFPQLFDMDELDFQAQRDFVSHPPRTPVKTVQKYPKITQKRL